MREGGTDPARPAIRPVSRTAARLSRAALLLVPAILAFAAQSPSLSHDLAGDDLQIILANPQITGAVSALDILRTDWFDSGGATSIGYYRPVTKASFRLTWALAGPDGLAFHFVSLVAHAAGVLILTLLLAQLFDDRIAVLGASLWGLHPMTVQAVQNVAALSDVLAGGFFLATLALVALWVRTRHAGWLAASSLPAALAVGSKESAVLVPAAAFVLVLCLGSRVRKAFDAALVTGVGVGAVLALRLSVLEVSPLPNVLATLNPGQKLAAILKAIGTYAVSLLTGHPIVTLPQVPDGFVDAGVLGGLLVAGTLVTVLVVTRLRTPAALGAVVLGASLAPALAIWHLRIPMWKGEIPVAERWLYLPAAGAAILAASALRLLPVRAGTLAGTGLAAALAFGTWQLNPAYASEETYADWAASFYLSTPPRNPREEYLSRVYRARQLQDAFRNEEALQELLAADAIAPWLPVHLWQMAGVQLALGRPEDAVRSLERFLSPSFRHHPDGLEQRIEMGDDSIGRIPLADSWRFLARAREAARDLDGAREARAMAAALDQESDSRLQRPENAANAPLTGPEAPSP